MHIHYYKPLAPPFLWGVITSVIEHAVCQWLTPVVELGCLTSKHHWSANWGGGDTRCCSVFFFCRGQSEHATTLLLLPAPLLVCTSPLFLSSSSFPFISLSPFPLFHLQQPHLRGEQGIHPPRLHKTSVLSQAKRDLTHHCSPAF